jgi:DNA repair protein SbcD/Mre11
MFKFLHAADLHLDSPMKGLERYDGAPVELVRGATRRALENLVHLALEEHANFLVIAGDLYDQDWKDYNTALFLAAQMSRLRQAGIRVYIVTGNHDAASQITRSLRMPDNVRLLSAERPESVVLDDLGVAIHGQSFATRAVRDDLCAAYPPALRDLFNIGLLHTAATGREGHEPYAPCSIEELLSRNYDYWALGHVHEREILYRDPWVVFPGNTQGRHVRECGPKGCTLVKVEDGNRASVEHRDLNVVTWAHCEIDAVDANSPEDVIDAARLQIEQQMEGAGGRLLAVRIEVHGATTAHSELAGDLEKWTSEIRAAATDVGGGAVWIEQVKFRTWPLVDLDKGLAQDDAVAEVLRLVRDLESSDEIFQPVVDELATLRTRLPGDLVENTPALNLASPDNARAVLEDVKRLLFTRLLSAGGAQ